MLCAAVCAAAAVGVQKQIETLACVLWSAGILQIHHPTQPHRRFQPALCALSQRWRAEAGLGAIRSRMHVQLSSPFGVANCRSTSTDSTIHLYYLTNTITLMVHR